MPEIVDTLSPFLAQMAARVKDPDTPLAAIGELMVASTQKNFEQQGRPTKWPALSPATVLSRLGGRRALTKKGTLKQASARRLAGLMMLIISGRLLRSITYAVDLAARAVSWGTNVIYARLLNFGGTAGRGHKVRVPAREYIHAPFEEDWREIERMFVNWLGWAQ
jgi:phage gpG-like protein